MKLTKMTERNMIDRKIVEGLLAHKSQRTLVNELRVGFRRIVKVEKLAREAGYLDGSVPLPAFPEALFEESRRSPSQPSDPEEKLLPHMAWMAERLAAGWHKVTVHEEILAKVQVGRSSFYRFLDRHHLGMPPERDRVVPEIVHKPGEALLLDWGHLCTIKCPETGKKRMVWAFVGILGFSRRMTVRLVWTNSVDVTMAAIEEMLVEFGGVPTRVTSDNPKCFALQADSYQPLLNPAFEMLASHYGFVIECLPPRDPEKKGKVERPMPFVRRLFEAHGEWKGIEEAQAYLDTKIAIANERKHGTTGEKPSVRFTEAEKDALKALPALRFERQEMAEPTVRQDGHVRFKGKYYSVGEGLRGQDVVVLGNARIVRVYHKGKLLCVHDRVTDRAESKSTKEEHKKPWERTFADNDHLLEKAARIGSSVRTLVECVLATQNGFVETRMVWGIFHLATLYSRKDVDDACGMALEVRGFSYREVKRILESTSTPSKLEGKRKHAFTRDMNEYTNHIKTKESAHECHSPAGTTPHPEAFNRRAGASQCALGDEEERANGVGGFASRA